MTTKKQKQAKPFESYSLENFWKHEHAGKLLGLLLVVLGFTVASLLLVELAGGTEQFRGWIQNAGVWAPVVYILLKASTYVIAPLSGTSVKLASGALFGTWEGMLWSLAGDTLGGSLNYWIARTLGRKGISKFAGKKALTQVDHAAERVGGWKALLGARLLLSAFYDFISYAAGLARISFAQFFAVTTIGGIPISIFFAMVGNATVESSGTSSVLIAISVALFVIVGIAFVTHRRQQSRLATSTEETSS
jgi:uncharacterized membrane protein YdjX (TVP38/TMEM64 family)